MKCKNCWDYKLKEIEMTEYLSHRCCPECGLENRNGNEG